MRSRAIFFLMSLLAIAGIAWIFSRYAGSSPSNSGSQSDAASHVTVMKQPVAFITRTFDPANPPSDLPPLSEGEIALCDASYISNVSVAGEGKQTDSTHEIVTITGVKATLQLVVTIWLPVGASPHVAEHEDGHRQIAEALYQNADKLVAQIAASYIGKKDFISGADLNAGFTQLLQQESQLITDDYNKQLNPEPFQLRYDALTDHARNDISAADAVSQIVKDLTVASSSPGANPPASSASAPN